MIFPLLDITRAISDSVDGIYKSSGVTHFSVFFNKTSRKQFHAPVTTYAQSLQHLLYRLLPVVASCQECGKSRPLSVDTCMTLP